MFQLDDNFLASVGLGDLPAEQKQAFLNHLYEELELRVGTKLSEGMNEQQMMEFESFIDRDEPKVRAWLERYINDYANQPDFLAMSKSAPADVEEVALLSEYASLKWLEMNRPDYKQVVAHELETLRQEVSANKDAIIGGAS